MPALEQFEIYSSVHFRKQRYAGAKQDRVNVDAELVNQSCFEQRLTNQTAAHHDDVFAFFRLEPLHQAHGVGRELDFLARNFLERARANVAFDAAVAVGDEEPAR